MRGVRKLHVVCFRKTCFITYEDIIAFVGGCLSVLAAEGMTTFATFGSEWGSERL